jgi:transcriptional regulator with XRE-family HTH domain
MREKTVKPTDKLIGQNIRAARLARGVTQQGLAKRIGVTFQQVQKYETGTNGVRGSRLVQIASALNTGVAVLFEGTETGCRPVHSGLPDLIVNPYATRMLRAFSKINQSSAQQALAVLTEEMAGKP